MTDLTVGMLLGQAITWAIVIIAMLLARCRTRRGDYLLQFTITKSVKLRLEKVGRRMERNLTQTLQAAIALYDAATLERVDHDAQVAFYYPDGRVQSIDVAETPTPNEPEA